MNLVFLIIILLVGLITGFINTWAGGGSLISLPVLIFLGLPSNVANGTNRLGILAQGIFAVQGFKSKGISAYPYSLYLGISSVFGAILGAKIAIDIQDSIFNKILALVMVLVILNTIFNSPTSIDNSQEKTAFKDQLLGIICFFFIGIYGGFIQAGVGFLIITALTSINKFNLVKANSAKVFIVVVYTMMAVIIFASENKINWLYGLNLGIGNAIGGWFASRWSTELGDVWIKRFLLVTVIALALKLWFF